MGRIGLNKSAVSRKAGIEIIKPARDERALQSQIIGRGEMAELTRRFDWKSTSIGDIEGWPDTLLTTVNLLLASRHPMFLWWGPDLIQFYNDGYRPSIRADKHPSALGQRGIDCWPEIWPIIGPQIEAVMSRGESTWNTNQLVPINRNGKLEEVFWTYSYSPVRDKDGTVRGTLVVCSETTEQVLSERRLRALLGIKLDFLVPQPAPGAHPLLALGQSILQKLSSDSADIPFAALYLLEDGNIFRAETASMGAIGNPENWPLGDAINSQTPMLLDDLQSRFADMVFAPWPEPVKQAYVLPLRMPRPLIQAVLVSGISPRLPFDQSYQTFFQLLGSRITSLLQNEAYKLEVAEAARKFSRLADANPFGTVIGDLTGAVKYVNPAFLQTLGYTEADVVAGKVRWDSLTPPEYREADELAVQQIRRRGRCDVYEKAYIARDGHHVPVLMGAAVIDSADLELQVAAFLTDLTPLKTVQEALRKANEELERKVSERTAALEAEIAERKRAETSLRELTGRLLRTQDEERRRLARELHDHAGQTLVALGFNLSSLRNLADDKDATVVDLVRQSQDLSETLSKEIRTLSYLLHPPLLDEAGLKSALQWYVDGFSKRSGIAVSLELPAEFHRIPRELEIVVFRVVQESLTNVHRHSGSPSAAIRLSRSAESVTIEIEDRGKGIPFSNQEMEAARIGVGVRGMEERVRQFGGTLKIDSSARGTRIRATIPLKAD